MECRLSSETCSLTSSGEDNAESTRWSIYHTNLLESNSNNCASTASIFRHVLHLERIQNPINSAPSGIVLLSLDGGRSGSGSPYKPVNIGNRLLA